MQLDRRTCDRARKSRDARFDGRFFIAITSTGIYCRPICPTRFANDENVRYFPSAAAAQVAGYRPCLRCRPEASPGTPAWLGTSGLVSRGLRLIGEGALDDAGVDELADRLGVTARHLRRLFVRHLGATPSDVAVTRRLHFAKKLIDETRMTFHDVAFAAGFGSVRRFNDQIRGTYGRAPTDLRRRARAQEPDEPQRYRLRLGYRAPYDWDGVLAYLAAHAVPGIEEVKGGVYRRTVEIDGARGSFEVSNEPARAALLLDVRFPDARALLGLVERVRRVFDLGADPAVLAAELGADPSLRRLLAARPGVRIPGAWDGFEAAVAALVGGELAGKIAAAHGARVATTGGPGRVFPPPARLAAARLGELAVPGAHQETIRALARALLAGTVTLRGHVDARTAIAHLTAIPGVRTPLAEDVAMRALGEPDAFPHDDPALREITGDRTARDLERRAQAWRPWRAYAFMLLWHAAHAAHARSADARRADQVRSWPTRRAVQR